MPDAANRPTPKELAAYWGGTSLLDVLRQEGYVIVHPDDVPAGLDEYGRWTGQVESARRIGWDDCRAHIFGDNQ